MKVVLVMLNNFQDYILDNIANLMKFQNKDIGVITDLKFKHIFKTILKEENVITVEDLLPNYGQEMHNISNSFRNGFWKLTTYRFYALQKYMQKFNVTNIIHIENDVLVYQNLDKINFHANEKILLTMDSNVRCIPGLMFIPNCNVLEACLQHFREGLNDMENWGICFNKLPQLIDNLPIFRDDKSNSEKEMITRNFHKYNVIFDAAAIGQYLGGIDPRNHGGTNTIGFVNETCVFNYSKYKFIWRKNEEHCNVPYININGIEYPIMNLHIHCKNLKKFI